MIAEKKTINNRIVGNISSIKPTHILCHSQALASHDDPEKHNLK